MGGSIPTSSNTNNVKIAYIINEYPKVSHSFIRREILALERLGLEVQRIATRGWSGPLVDEVDISERGRTRYVLQDGILGLLLPTLVAFVRSPLRFIAAVRLTIAMAKDSDRSLAHHLVYVAEACKVLGWVNRSRSERLHAHFGTNSADVAMLATALGGPPYSFTVHGPEEFLRQVGLREKTRRSDFVVAISSFGRSQLALSCPTSAWDKIKIVHCGLEREFYAGIRNEAPETSQRLVCVGRLTAGKGQFLLVEAAARLAAAGCRFELVLAGDGSARHELEKLIEKHALQSDVRITGWISSSQVRDEILAARALVLPSFAEGLPVVIMEAMALRRPVLATYVAGVPELVQHGVTGWLFPAGSLDDLVAAIVECLSATPTELKRLGDAGYERVIARHAIDHEAARLATLFKRGNTPR